MASVRELSDPYGNFMLAPRHGPAVCEVCLNLTDGFARCYACTHLEHRLDVVLPISYSVAAGQLHHALRGYKRFEGEVARRLGLQLAAVMWRFLDVHERCIARAARIAGFDLVTTVPSGDRELDVRRRHPLAWLIGEVVGPTRDRYRPLLLRSEAPVERRAFSDAKFVARERLEGRSVLLVDDTWTTGASAQSAAAALRSAGAERVAAVVIGRHINAGWHDNARRLRAMETPFDWQHCALCARE